VLDSSVDGVKRWCLSRIARNVLAHIANGNGTRNLTETELSHLFVAAHAESTNTAYPSRGFVARVNKRYSACSGSARVHPNTLKRRLGEWWDVPTGTMKRSPRKKLKLQRVLKKTLSPAGDVALQQTMVRRKLSFRGVARSGLTFQSPTGAMVPVSRKNASRICKEAKLEISFPVDVRVSGHSPHHKRSRISWCTAMLARPRNDTLGIFASDEQSYEHQLKRNRRNQCFVVDPGQRKGANVQRRSKGDGHQCFSLWWVISRRGVVCYDIYRRSFNMEFYESLLNDKLKPAVRRLKRLRPPVVCSLFLHDAVSGRAAHEPLYDTLESIFGIDGFLEHAPPPCKFDTGRIRDVPCVSKNGNPYTRHDKVKEDCDPCQCDFAWEHYPSSSPELNPAENAQNMLKHNVIPDLLKEDGIEWTGSVQNKINILKRAIEILDDGVTYPNYFENLFQAQPGRYERVIDTDGDLLEN
jgi:hypothetical protein